MARKRAIAGGLLSGLGTGMVAKAERLREDALERLRRDERRTEREEDRDFRRELQEDDQKFRGGLLSRIEPDENLNLQGITAAGDTKDLGMRVPRKASDDDDGMSAADKRLWDIVVKKHTSKEQDADTLAMRETIDWSAVASDLMQRNRLDLAQIADPAAGSTSDEVPETDDANTYQSPDDVKAAYQQGTITREQALEILRKDFGMQ